MVRNLKEEIPNAFKAATDSGRYFEEMVKSFAFPYKRYTIKLEGEAIEVGEDLSEYDMLSPPSLLDLSDSMGAFKNTTKINQDYGEVIVEVRAISNVEAWLLNKIGLNSLIGKGSFLTTPTNELTDQVMRLFAFLREFNRPEMWSEIKRGIQEVIAKHK